MSNLSTTDDARWRRRGAGRVQGVGIPHETGPLDVLAGRGVLVLADVENLRYGARDLGFALSSRSLAEVLDLASPGCDRHAFFSRMPGDCALEEELESCGWITHPGDVQHVRSRWGYRRRANSDNAILFHAGHLAANSDTEVVVLASGDGDLVSDLARCLRALRRDRRVATLSLAGSTSCRLDCRSNPDISANLEIGMDCLRGSVVVAFPDTLAVEHV